MSVPCGRLSRTAVEHQPAEEAGGMMATQFSFPASWTSRFISNRDPHEQLAMLRKDVLKTRADIRLVLKRLAEKREIPMEEVTRAMGSVDDGLSDRVYDIELEIEDEPLRTDRYA